MSHDFLLRLPLARELYASVKDLPIVDYHNHLSLSDIKENKRFFDVYELWIAPDPYKHRAMRMCGIPERQITGDASAEEKFCTWWHVLPRLIGNPLYTWCCMELAAVFGMDYESCEMDGKEAYLACNAHLHAHEVTAQTLLSSFSVECACPCASLLDDVTAFADNPLLSPSLRADDAASPTKEFLERLFACTHIEIRSLSEFKEAIRQRLSDFEKAGCRFADHALDNGFRYHAEDEKNDARFASLLEGTLSTEERERLCSHILTFLAEEYARRGFVLQLHIGAERKTSTRLRALAGAQGGFAAIGNSADIKSLTVFFDALEKSEGGIPKTVLFTLNPADNAMLTVLSGSYARDGVSGLITQGPAWWWCDHKYGIREVLESTAAFGLLSNFVGMTTDSRSLLSFVRHDYFRRILCDLLAEKVLSGEYPKKHVKDLLRALCYENASRCMKTNP